VSAVSASAARSPAALAAEPILWHNFFSEKDLTWNLLCGRMGYRRGDLVLKGEGSSPVMLAPHHPAIAWDLYQAVQIRMMAEGGHEIKIKIAQRDELLPENHIDSLALVDADWKLIYREKGKEVGMNKVELYDRRTERGDTSNVAARHPRRWTG
jgi:hypothetical protein